MVGDTGTKRPSFRLLAAFALAAILLLLLFVAVCLGPSFLQSNEFAQVRSIETDPTYQNPGLMRTAWTQPVAQRYRDQPFEYQQNQSVCAAASVANVLHSLGSATNQEAVLEDVGERTFFGYLAGGLTLDQLGLALSQRVGRPVKLRRDLSLTQFRAQMRQVNDPHSRVIANFHRGPLFARGHGHFSPLMAYLEDRDLILVGDVNEQFRPFLVKTERLWRAVNTTDPETRKSRGLAVMTTG